jgi:hypothetical protein
LDSKKAGIAIVAVGIVLTLIAVAFAANRTPDSKGLASRCVKNFFVLYYRSCINNIPPYQAFMQD